MEERSWRTSVFNTRHSGSGVGNYGSRDPMAEMYSVGDGDRPLAKLWACGPAPGGGGGYGLCPPAVPGVDPGADPYTREPLDNSLLRGVPGNGYALLTAFSQLKDPIW